MIVFFLGCYPQPLGQTPSNDYNFSAPSIIDAGFSCEDEQWLFTAEADAWTGNGFILMANEERFERHPIYSVQGASDGSWDLLQLRLSTVADWRDYSSGLYSGWLCSQRAAISIALSIYEPEGTLSDCLYWGDDIWEDFSTVEDCTPLE